MRRLCLYLLCLTVFLLGSALPIGTSATPATKIKVYNFLDAREGKLDPYLIGSRTAAFGVVLGDVYSERPVVENVTEAVKSELIRMGYHIVRENEDFIVKGKIHQFWGKTLVKMHGWDVVGEVSLILEVSRPDRSLGTTLGPYTDQKMEREFINPGQKKIKRLLTAALNGAIQKMSADPLLISALSK